MLTGAAQYDSAFSKTKWALVPGHSKLYYEADTVVEEMVSPIKAKRATKFDKFRSHASVTPAISDKVSGCLFMSTSQCGHEFCGLHDRVYSFYRIK
jgi:hypothetical protein